MQETCPFNSIRFIPFPLGTLGFELHFAADRRLLVGIQFTVRLERLLILDVSVARVSALVFAFLLFGCPLLSFWRHSLFAS